MSQTGKDEYKSSGSSTASSDGCYIATCIYGSYDCPPVWVLRRFRDFQLAEMAVGRLFIRAYYAVSPHVVAMFGSYEWFRTLCKKPLDRLVKRLIKKGVKYTPYDDPNHNIN